MIWLTHICKVNIILKEYKKELKSTFDYAIVVAWSDRQADKSL